MTEHEENNQEDVGETTEEEQEEENDEGPEWATVLSHIQAGDYSSAIAAVPTIQRPSHIKGVAEVAAYLDSHAIKYKRLAVGKTANKLSVCRLTRRFLDGEWKEIEPCNRGFLVAGSKDGCTLTRHINTYHFGASRR